MSITSKDVWRSIVGIIVCEMSGFIGALFTMESISTWYAHLNKPLLSPPNWVFGPVWTILYALMGIALYMVWRTDCGPERTQALRAFAIQFALNFIWTPIFFGLKNLGLAFLVIALMWLAIVYTIYTFHRVRPLAAYMLVPYLAWVSFASYLNFSVWMLN